MKNEGKFTQEDFKEEAIALSAVNSQLSSTEIGKIICKNHGLEYNESKGRAVRLWLSGTRDRLDDHKALSEECDIVGIPLDDVNYYWYKGQQFSINASGSDRKTPKEIFNEYIDEVRESIANSFKWQSIKYEKNISNYLIGIFM